MRILPEPIVFQWDSGNQDKNWLKHKVTNQECEEVFFDGTKKIIRDIFHSNREERYIILGHTKQQRTLFIVFTIRRGKIRLVSARDLNHKEHKLLYI